MPATGTNGPRGIGAERPSLKGNPREHGELPGEDRLNQVPAEPIGSLPWPASLQPAARQARARVGDKPEMEGWGTFSEPQRLHKSKHNGLLSKPGQQDASLAKRSRDHGPRAAARGLTLPELRSTSCQPWPKAGRGYKASIPLQSASLRPASMPLL